MIQPASRRETEGEKHSRRCAVFFFQAEDGIRDLTVTGVQTCALPIYQVSAKLLVDHEEPDARKHSPGKVVTEGASCGPSTAGILRKVGGMTQLNFAQVDRKSTRLNSSHSQISYAVFCLKKKNDSRLRPLCDPEILQIARGDLRGFYCLAVHQTSTRRDRWTRPARGVLDGCVALTARPHE